MRTTALLTFSIVFLMTLVSCNREHPDSLHVRVVEKGTNKPIPDALVEVFRNRIHEDPKGNDKYDKLYTDNRGEVYVDAKKGGVPTRVEVYSPDSNYYDRRHSSGSGSAAITEPFRKNPVIELTPYSWIYIESKWEYFEGEYDFIRWQGPFYLDQKSFYFNHVFGPICWFGNQENTLRLFGYKNGETKKIWSNYVFCPGHDTVHHVMEP